MAQDIDPFKLSSPRIFLIRMMVFLILCALVVVVLYRQIWVAFLANPGLNALIIGVLLIGVAFAFRQVIRLFPEVSWVNGFRLADPGLAVERPPVLLAPMAAILGDRSGPMAISAQVMRGILDSIATRLDEARDMARYMTGLLVFLGLLGTFWGLIETVGSVGKVIENLNVTGDAGNVFDALKEGLAAPLGVAWVACTFLGAVLGSFLGDPRRVGADFAFTALFIGLIAGFWNGRVAGATIAASGAVAAVVYATLGAPWHVAAGAFAGIAAAYLAAPAEGAAR